MFTLELLKEMYEISKILKSEYIIFNQNIVLGADQFCSKLVVLKIDKSYPYLSFNYKEMTDFIKVADNISCYPNMIISNNEWVAINNHQLDIPILNTFKELQNEDYTLYNKDLTDYEPFRKACSGKVADGLTLLNIPINNCVTNEITTFPVSVYGGLLPINKKDKIEIGICYVFGSATFRSRYSIVKSKSTTLEVYVNYLFI